MLQELSILTLTVGTNDAPLWSLFYPCDQRGQDKKCQFLFTYGDVPVLSSIYYNVAQELSQAVCVWQELGIQGSDFEYMSDCPLDTQENIVPCDICELCELVRVP